MYVYHGLCATVSERKAESDSIFGFVLGFTVALAWRNPHIIQVQRWSCGILRDCYVEPILAAGKMAFSLWMILFFCICRKHTDDGDDKARFNIWIFLSLHWENTTFSIPLTGDRHSLDNCNSARACMCHEDNSQICHVFLYNMMKRKRKDYKEKIRMCANITAYLQWKINKMTHERDSLIFWPNIRGKQLSR